MIPLAFCIPGDITLPTGGYRYDREALGRLSIHGVAADHIMLSPQFPAPDAASLAETGEKFRAIHPRTILLIDGLALGAMPPTLIEALPHRVVALVHHPLGLETGLSPDRAAFLLANERAVLAHVDHTIVTSRQTKRMLLADFGLSDRAVTVAEPGTDRYARSAGTGSPLQIVAVGAVSARKAYPLLVEALAVIAELDWHLTIAGSLTLSGEAADELRSAVAAHGLQRRVTLTGALDDAALAALYGSADLFAMSSLFEGYGMALTEALARGLPIVASSGGAAVETLPDHAAIQVPPGDVGALTSALRRVIIDPQLRRRMADSAWTAAALLPSWDDTARDIADVIKGL